MVTGDKVGCGDCKDEVWRVTLNTKPQDNQFNFICEALSKCDDFIPAQIKMIAESVYTNKTPYDYLLFTGDKSTAMDIVDTLLVHGIECNISKFKDKIFKK